MSICNSTNFLTFSNPISLNKTFSCKLILSLKISRRKVFIIKEDNSCVKLCWKMYWSQDVLSPVGYSQTKDVFIMYSTYWEILTKKLCHKFAYANEFEPIRGAKMVFTYEKKKIRPIRIATMFFSLVRKMIRPIRSHRGVSLVPKFLPFIGACSFADMPWEKFFSKSFSSKKSEKHPGNLSGIVLFVSLSMKKTVESWENKRKGKNWTRHKLKLC